MAPAIILHKSEEQEQIEADAPPPSWRVLQPDTPLLGPPHPRSTRITVSNLPTLEMQDDDVGGQITDQAGLGLNSSQLFYYNYH